MNEAVTVNKLNPTSQRAYLASINVVDGVNAPTPGSRVYFPHLPQIEAGQIVGISAFVGVRGPGATPQNISQFAPYPFGVINAGYQAGFEVAQLLLVTLVNKSGEILFDRVPFGLLYPILGRVQRYNAVNLDSRACYFTFPGALPVLAPNVPYNANLMFYMNYQNY